MKKFIFTPLWKVEKTEKILSDYEKDGYRLEKISFPYIFELKKSTPKNSMYFIMKYYRSNSHIPFDLEHNLICEHGCSPVGESDTFTGYDVFRTLRKDDFTEFKGMRADYFRKIYRDCLIGDIIFLVFFTVMFILYLQGNNDGNGNALFITYLMVLTLSSVYYLFGYIKERKDYNYYNKIYKDNKKASE